MAARGARQHPYPRTARINQVLREVIGEELVRLCDLDERVGLLTVTGVETTADLKYATVYLDSLDEASAEVLSERRVAIQASVNAQTRMKQTPKLRFIADPAVAAGASVEKIIRRLHDDES